MQRVQGCVEKVSVVAQQADRPRLRRCVAQRLKACRRVEEQKRQRG